MFPRMGLCNLICNWFCSDQSKKISPLSLIPRSHFDKKQQDWYSKMKSMMHLVEKAAQREGIWKQAGYYLGNYLRCTTLYSQIEKYFLYPTKKMKERRHLENSFKNALDLYRKFGKKFATELDNEH